MSITPGCIRRIFNGETNFSPVVQVLEIKKIQSPNQNTQDRFRLVISDGVAFIQAMIASQLNHIITSEEIAKNGLLQLDEFVCNLVRSRKVAIILNATVVQKCVNPIGNPQAIDGSQTPAGSAPATSTLAQPSGAPVQQQTPAYHQHQAPQQTAPQNYQNVQQLYAPQVYLPQQKTPTKSMPQAGPGKSPIAKLDTAHITPINTITPYMNRWTIKARVMSKGDMRSWKNAKGEGNLFSVDLCDESGEIRGTFFKEVANKFFSLLEKNKVYFFTKGTVKPANKKFNNLKNEYEITFDRETQIELCAEDSSIPKIMYNFVPISKIDSVEPQSTVDVIGVVKTVDVPSSIVSKRDGETIEKRNITIMDSSHKSISVTLWKNHMGLVDENMADRTTVIALKSLRVSDYGGRSLSTLASTNAEINPDINEAAQLRAWYDKEGKHVQVEPMSSQGPRTPAGPPKAVAQIRVEALGTGEKPDYFQLRGYVTHAKYDGESPPYYPACPNEGCQNKKVIQESDGRFSCENCGNRCDRPNYRYIINFCLADFSGMQWMTAFNEAGHAMLKIDANQLDLLRENNRDEYDHAFKNILLRPISVKVRARTERYMEEERLKVSVVDAKPFDFVRESANLLAEIEALTT